MQKKITYRVVRRDPQTRRVCEELGEAVGKEAVRALLKKHGTDLIEGFVDDIVYWQVPPPFDAVCVNMENIPDGLHDHGSHSEPTS